MNNAKREKNEAREPGKKSCRYFFICTNVQNIDGFLFFREIVAELPIILDTIVYSFVPRVVKEDISNENISRILIELRTNKK